MAPLPEITWFIETAKITEYLLNPNHNDGRSKAKYLAAFGFSVERPGELGIALAKHAMDNLPGKTVEPAGKPARLVYEGATQAPDGRMMGLRTV